VLDAVGAERAVACGASWSAILMLIANAMAPDRFAGLMVIGPLLRLAEPLELPILRGDHFFAPIADFEGADVSNRAFIPSATRNTSRRGFAARHP
jgi:pimeloyl-ACP methyl ester carboxylesterase